MLSDNVVEVIDPLTSTPFPSVIANTPLAQPMSGRHLMAYTYSTCLPVPLVFTSRLYCQKLLVDNKDDSKM